MQKTDNGSIQLLSARTKAAQGPMGWRNGTVVSIPMLSREIGLWKNTLANIPGQKCALYFEDALEFTAALIAALQQNRTVFLPSNALPATCESLSKSVDVFIGDFPETCHPVTILKTGAFPLQKDEDWSVPSTSEIVVFTSGSTGEPKAIPKRINQLIEEVKTLEKTFGDKCPGARIVTTVSHHHIYGLLFRIFWPLFTGRPVNAFHSSFPEELVEAMSGQASVLVSSPAHLKRFTKSEVFRNTPSDVRAIFSSGGPLDRETALEIGQVFGTVPFEIYGSSETGGIAWRRRSEHSDESWIPLSGVDWRIASQNDALEIRSPYLYDSDWLQMADSAVAGKENRFFLNGRIDRIVKIEEKRVSLTAIEKKLMTSGLVSECRVIVVDMETAKRQRFAAFIVLNAKGLQFFRDKGKLALNRLLRQELSSAFEPVTLPKIWRYLKNLPVNVQGKTTYSDLLALLEESSTKSKNLPAERRPVAQLLQKTDRYCLLRLEIPCNLLYFRGHFAEKPVLPGVVQVDWAIAFGKRYFDISGFFSGMRLLKFQRLITPGAILNLSLEFNREKKLLSFRYFLENEQYSSGNISFDTKEKQEDVHEPG